MKNGKIHSEEWINDARQYWWNDDYIDLMLKRYKLLNTETMADIGCGKGYMTFKFLPHLEKLTTCYGRDIENEHISSAITIAKTCDKEINFNFKTADAYSIDIPDNTSDLTVCQTLLLHLDNPLDNLKYDLTIQKGIHALKEGFISLGDYVPKLFLEAGLKDIDVSIVDKACSLIPPYDTAEKKARAKELLDWIDNSQAEFDKKQMLKYYLAGGGNEQEFNTIWEEKIKESAKIKKAILEEKYIMPGGALMYIITAKK